MILFTTTALCWISLAGGKYTAPLPINIIVRPDFNVASNVRQAAVEATARIKQFISVPRASTGLVLRRESCNRTTTPCRVAANNEETCGLTSIPAVHLEQADICGLNGCIATNRNDELMAEADHIVYLSNQNHADCSAHFATATVCRRDDEYERPIASNINVCPLADDAFSSDDLSNLLLHELVHALGFTMSSIERYKDCEEGTTVYTSSCSPYNSLFSPSSGNADGTWLLLPRASAAYREQFGCPSSPGALLFSEGGIIEAHWHPLTAATELMAAGWILQHSSTRVLTNLTLGLLRDSGWYIVQTVAADSMAWMRGSGCSMASGVCPDLAAENHLPFGVCRDLGTPLCYPNQRQKAICTGDDSLRSDCPSLVPLTGSTANCELNTGQTTTVSFERFGASSYCFDPALLCLNTMCFGNDLYVQLAGESYLRCTPGTSVLVSPSMLINCSVTVCSNGNIPARSNLTVVLRASSDIEQSINLLGVGTSLAVALELNINACARALAAVRAAVRSARAMEISLDALEIPGCMSADDIAARIVTGLARIEFEAQNITFLAVHASSLSAQSVAVLNTYWVGWIVCLFLCTLQILGAMYVLREGKSVFEANRTAQISVMDFGDMNVERQQQPPAIFRPSISVSQPQAGPAPDKPKVKTGWAHHGHSSDQMVFDEV